MSANALPVLPFEFAQQGDFQDNFTYTVPASGEVQPYTSTASFTNASGQAVQPTISMYSANGNLLARVYPVTSLADGDDAEVTWMPPFGSAASSSVIGSGITEITSTDGSVSVTDPFGPTTDLSVAPGYCVLKDVTTNTAISAGGSLTIPSSAMTINSGDTLISGGALTAAGLFVFQITFSLADIGSTTVGTQPVMFVEFVPTGTTLLNSPSQWFPIAALGGSVSGQGALTIPCRFASSGGTFNVILRNVDSIDHGGPSPAGTDCHVTITHWPE